MSESKRIVEHTRNTVGVSIPISVKAIEAKKALFDEAEVGSLIEATILLLRNDHETFSEAVGAKLSVDQVAAGVEVAGEIDAVLLGAALFYADDAIPVPVPTSTAT